MSSSLSTPSSKVRAAMATFKWCGARRLWATWLLVVVPLFAACPEDPRTKHVQVPVAEFGAVGSKGEVTQQQFLQALTWAAAGRLEQSDRAALGRHVLSRSVDEALMESYAAEHSISISDDDVKHEVRRVRAQYKAGDFARFVHNEQMTLQDHENRVRLRLLTDKVLKTILKKSQKVTEEKILRAYQTQIVDQPKPAQVRVRQVLVATEEEATHILSELRRKRVTFAAAARRYSDGSEAQKGGDLGWFSKEGMPEVFEQCFSLSVDQISDVVPSMFGFHIFQVLGKREKGYVPSLLEVRKQLTADLRREQETAAMEAFLVQLRRTAAISVNEQAFQATIQRLPPLDSASKDAGASSTLRQDPHGELAHSHSQKAPPPPAPPSPTKVP